MTRQRTLSPAQHSTADIILDTVPMVWTTMRQLLVVHILCNFPLKYILYAEERDEFNSPTERERWMDRLFYSGSPALGWFSFQLLSFPITSLDPGRLNNNRYRP